MVDEEWKKIWDKTTNIPEKLVVQSHGKEELNEWRNCYRRVEEEKRGKKIWVWDLNKMKRKDFLKKKKREEDLTLDTGNVLKGGFMFI